MKHDLIHALRVLWRNRRTSAVAIMTLAFGIAFAVAVFSVADRVLFRPLPYPHPEQLVELRLTGLPMGRLPLSARELSGARSAAIFQAAEGYDMGREMTRVDGAQPERLQAAAVTAGLLDLLGARIAHGRGFAAGDALDGAEPVAILAHPMWRTRFGGDPSVVGSLMRFDEGPPIRIVGILGDGFVFPTPIVRLTPDLMLPIPNGRMNSDGRWLTVIARLRPPADATAADGLVPVDTPPAGTTLRVEARRLDDALGYGARRGLVGLFAAAVVLLLIGGFDVAGLLLAHSTTRDREIVTRRALGASTWRLTRQLVTEGAVIAVVSGATGLLGAFWLFDYLMALVPPDLQLIHPAGIDARAAAFAMGTSMTLAVIFGLAPLVHLRKVHVTGAAVLRSGATHGGTAVRRMASMLVCAQIAAAVVLVVVGGLLVTSFWRVSTVNTGMETRELALLRSELPAAMRREAGLVYPAALTQLQRIPGVTSVALIDSSLFELSYRRTRLRPLGRTVPPAAGPISDVQSSVTPGYFAVAGIPIVAGRGFSDADAHADSAPVAIVSQAVAERWWPGLSPIGQQIAWRQETKVVVGVVEDVRQVSPRMPPPGEIYIPLTPANMPMAATVLVRTSRPSSVVPQSVTVMRTLAPGVAILSAAPADDRVAAALVEDRFYAVLFGLVACAGLVLGALGAYGMIDWSIARRRREMGLRAALGATPRALAIVAGRQLVVTSVWGTAAGLFVAAWATRLVQALLFEVEPGSLPVWVAAVAVVAVTVCAALALPVRRVIHCSPAEALREE